MSVVAGASRRWWGLVAVALGVAVIVIDTTVVNVIVPSLIRDLDVDSQQVQWVSESYAIVFAALLLLTGRLSDLRGARAVFLGGMLVFGLASIGCAAAGDGGLLIAARAVQGIGGAMILPASLALINNTFEGADRGKAFAVWGSTIGAGAAVGPLLGGWLDGYSWRWVFGVNIAVMVVVVAGVRAFLAPSPRVPGRIDTLGVLWSVLGLGLVAFGVVEGRTYGWFTTLEPLSLSGLTWDADPSPAFVALVAGAAFLGLLVQRQVQLTRRDAAPLVDVRLFRIRSFTLGNLTTLLIGLGEFGIIAIVPLWLQFTLGYSPVQAGLAITALAVGSFVASGASFGLSASVSATNLVRLGLALEIAGLVLLGLVAAPDSAWWQIAAALFVYGVGTGFATAQVTNVVLVDVPAASAGSGSGVQSAIRQVGSALGIAAVTTVFFTSFAGELGERLDRLPQPVTVDADAVVDSGGAALLTLGDSAEGAAGRAAMSEATGLASYVAGGLLAVGLGATALLGSGRLRPDEAPSDSPDDVAAGAHR